MSLQYAILGIINYMPQTGYDIKQTMDRAINFFWSAQLSQIYRELGALEKKAYVVCTVEKQETRPDKKIYSITDVGKTAFKEWIVKFPEKNTTQIKDEFLVRLFFGNAIPKEELIFQLKKFKKEKEEELRMFDHSEEQIKAMKNNEIVAKDTFYWNLTLKRGISDSKVSIEWADECIEMLENCKDCN